MPPGRRGRADLLEKGPRSCPEQRGSAWKARSTRVLRTHRGPRGPTKCARAEEAPARRVRCAAGRWADRMAPTAPHRGSQARRGALWGTAEAEQGPPTHTVAGRPDKASRALFPSALRGPAEARAGEAEVLPLKGGQRDRRTRGRQARREGGGRGRSRAGHRAPAAGNTGVQGLRGRQGMGLAP